MSDCKPRAARPSAILTRLPTQRGCAPKAAGRCASCRPALPTPTMKYACSSRVAWKRGPKACTTCSTRSPGWRFPRTKARINAMHAERIPHERGRRGRLRDLLTLFDEGGAIVACADAELLALLRGFRWKELFWEHRRRVLRSMRISVLGHAVLEKALEPWPGITCKAIFVAPGADADAQAAAWLAPARAA